MPRVSAENKQFYRSKIRSLIVQNPQITQRELKERLEKDGLTLDRKYLGSLVNGIYAERAHRIDKLTLDRALAGFADAMDEIATRGWEIVNSAWLDPKARVMALKEIREAHNAVFEKLFDAGVFDRKLGTLDATIRNTPLPEDRKKAIRDVFGNWGLLEAPKEDATITDPKPENPA